MKTFLTACFGILMYIIASFILVLPWILTEDHIISTFWLKAWASLSMVLAFYIYERKKNMEKTIEYLVYMLDGNLVDKSEDDSYFLKGPRIGEKVFQNALTVMHINQPTDDYLLKLQNDKNLREEVYRAVYKCNHKRPVGIGRTPDKEETEQDITGPEDW